MFWIAQTIPWELAPTILTFAAASARVANPDASASIDFIQVLAGLLVALVALCQSILFLPQNTGGRFLLFAFALWPLGSFFYQTSASGASQYLPGGIWAGPKPSSKHPIEELILQAQKDYDRLIKSQSQDIEGAEQEYRRRYSRDPPPGFDKWFAYAQSKQSLLIDDYDMINEDLKPFWQVSPQRLLESIDHVSSFEHLALRKCGFTKGEYHGQGGGWIVEDLGHKLLEEVKGDIPDVEFAFDVVDEPRVIITQQMLEAGGVAKPEFYNAEHRSIWSRVTASCQNDTSIVYKPKVYDYGIPFVQDWYQAKDVCQHPEFSELHGFFASPETCILTDAPIPVLSQAAPTTFGDIMYPSPWYPAKVDQGVYKPEEDPDWDQKSNTLYWAGSTTGSHSWNGSWRQSQRQRFVQLIQTMKETKHHYLEQDTPASWKDYEAIEDHSALYDVKLTAIIQCDEADCEEQREYFDVHDKEDREQQFKSRFIFDVDGNSFSGRFYTLLQSRSVVLKQTVLREWHDERLIPWVHYVPVSMGMQELPEIMRYLTSAEGEKWAKQIAEQSRDGHEKMLRQVDMTVYLYRLMLELARIMDPERKVERLT
ncbi:hypothetical protein SLS59_005165 [Nothophoma quercina]|uniref:Glycosyl transferase CAP10 domain-containing protein n=1 Tax=Nothophoma quercina TaxID=749835 RepID=A0ABR3RC57_9PLEO